MLLPTEIRKLLKHSHDFFIINKPGHITKAYLREIFSENVEFHLPFGMPPAKGIDELYCRCLLESEVFEHYEFEIKEPIIAGNCAASYMTATIKNLKNDDIVGFEMIEISEFNDDSKICKKMIYIDLEVLEHAIDQETLDKLFATKR